MISSNHEQTLFQVRMGWISSCTDVVFVPPSGTDIAYVNFASIIRSPRDEWKNTFKAALQRFEVDANGRKWGVNISPQFLNESIGSEITGALSVRDIDTLLDCVTLFTSVSQKHWIPVHTKENYPTYQIAKHRGLVRTGNLELCVVENFLRDRLRLKISLKNVLSGPADTTYMYGNGAARSWCTADDFEHNIRRLMTNAGFYASVDPEIAWRNLEDWATRYISAMKNNYLATSSHTYLFTFITQKLLWEQFGHELQYVHHPSPFEFYEQIAGRKVAFLTPLAHLVAQQYESERLWNLFKSRPVPRFELRTRPAWISTWPNRPHKDWQQTFDALCLQVEELAHEEPLDVFVASCGCYGLPLADFVRQKYECDVIYLGNITNFYFGVMQNATKDLMKEHQNVDMFVQSDLSKHRNVSLIDKGRYI